MAAHLGSADSLTLWGGGVVPEKETLPAIAPEPVSPADVTAAGPAATGSGSRAAPPPYAKAEKAPVAATTKGPLGTIVTLLRGLNSPFAVVGYWQSFVPRSTIAPHVIILPLLGPPGRWGDCRTRGFVFDRLAFPCSTAGTATPLPRFDVASKGGWRIDSKARHLAQLHRCRGRSHANETGGAPGGLRPADGGLEPRRRRGLHARGREIRHQSLHRRQGREGRRHVPLPGPAGGRAPKAAAG